MYIAIGVVAALAGLGAVLYFIFQKGKPSKREQYCLSMGWRYEALPEGKFRILGMEHGIRWTLETKDSPEHVLGIAEFSFAHPAFKGNLQAALKSYFEKHRPPATDPLAAKQELESFPLAPFGVDGGYVGVGDRRLAEISIHHAPFDDFGPKATLLNIGLGKLSLIFADYTPGQTWDEMETLIQQGIPLIDKAAGKIAPKKEAKVTL
jgi:hypothetical protein